MEATDDSSKVTIVLLGDPECGKSTFFARLSMGKESIGANGLKLPLLRDLDQPFIYDIRMYNRPYRFEFFDTSSPENFTLLRPDLVILCYNINDRRSLINCQQVWKNKAIRFYQVGNDRIPMMLLGLKRDLRVEEPGVIYPQEGYRIAQEMRCSRYAECSAVTGELMSEVFEDVARLAARTTTQNGAMDEPNCTVM